MTYLAEADRESALLPLQAASCTYRIALGPRAGQKVLSLQSVASPDKSSTPDLCAKLHGFSLHAAVRWGADQRKELELTGCSQRRAASSTPPLTIGLTYNLTRVFVFSQADESGLP